MLEHLFGSKTRVKLLRLLLNNPTQPYFLRELARKLKTQLNAVRREVENLEKVGIVRSVAEPEGAETVKRSRSRHRGGSKKYIQTNTDFILYPELKALLIKAQLLLERTFVGKIEKLSPLKLFVLSGFFIGAEDSLTDMLIVGSVNKHSLAKIIKEFERELDRSINYTVMSVQEYHYRQDITDRFLYDILESQKIVIVDKINHD